MEKEELFEKIKDWPPERLDELNDLLEKRRHNLWLKKKAVLFIKTTLWAMGGLISIKLFWSEFSEFLKAIFSKGL